MRKWLAQIRKEQGMRQHEVAAQVGISQSYYAEIETGARGRAMKANVAKKIAAVLGFEWTRFYEEDNDGQG